jgi:hypothetical protein
MDSGGAGSDVSYCPIAPVGGQARHGSYQE